MTVKELIMEVEFDDLLPYLKEIIVGHFDNIYFPGSIRYSSGYEAQP